MSQVFVFAMIWIFAFIPILIWGYIFSYLDNSVLNGRRFLAWIIAWAFSVVPVLYLENILDYFSLSNFNIFALISSHSSNYFFLGLSIIIITLIISVFLFITWIMFIKDFEDVIKIYLKNIFVIVLFSLPFILVYFISDYLPFLRKNITNSIHVSNFVFNTLGLILFYYIIIWFIEEASKHFSFLPSSLAEINSIKKWVLLAIFIALWFWFIENILYLYSVYNQKWLFSGNFLVTWIFRWIFSLFVHVLCSAVVWFYFTRAFLNFKKWFLNYFYVQTFLYWILFSIVLHAIFDISLTLNFTVIIFIYAISWYMYVTRIFAKN